jgi:SNF2 family DNA or RNA helicase
VIDIFLQKGRLHVRLDPTHKYYDRVLVLVMPLLSAFEQEANVWSMDYDDLELLKEKLDQFGLVMDRTITDEALDRINYYQYKIEYNNQIKNRSNNDEIRNLIKGKIKTSLYEDQITGVAYLNNNPRAGLFDSMGVGKSAQALTSSIVSGCDRVLIICPKSVLSGFYREVEKHTDRKATIVPPGKEAIPFLRKEKNKDWNYLLVNPETLVGSGKKDGIGDTTLFLKDMSFDMIIVDEFHMYKNLTAKRTKCMSKLLKEIKTSSGKVPRVIVMTGTPVSESPINAYTFLRSVGVYLPHVNRFESYFTIKETKTYGKQKSFKKIVGYKNLSYLKRRIERRSIRRTKEDLVGFPDITMTCRDVEITGLQRKLYNAIQTELLHELPQSSKVNLMQFLSSAKAIRLRQVLSSPEILGEKAPSAKHEEVDIILEELFQDPESKVILWTEYRNSVDLLYERYNDLYGAFKLYGGMDIDSALIEKFEAPGGPRVAVAIPAKAGTGVDFLARARTAIYVDRPYSYVLYKQSLDRIHRRVKTVGELSWLDRIRSQPANIIFLDGVNTIDELVRDKLELKSDIADAITTSNDKLVEIGREDLLRYLK